MPMNHLDANEVIIIGGSHAMPRHDHCLLEVIHATDSREQHLFVVHVCLIM